MTAPYIIPFDNNPVNVATGTSGTYTVPTGKYSKIRLTTSLTATPLNVYLSGDAQSFTSGFPLTINMQNAVSNESMEFWLNEGDTITCTTSAASGTVDIWSASGSTTYNDRYGSTSVDSTCTITINGTTHIILYAKCSVYFYCGRITASSTGASSVKATFTGTATWGYCAQEYNVVS